MHLALSYLGLRHCPTKYLGHRLAAVLHEAAPEGNAVDMNFEKRLRMPVAGTGPVGIDLDKDLRVAVLDLEAVGEKFQEAAAEMGGNPGYIGFVGAFPEVALGIESVLACFRKVVALADHTLNMLGGAVAEVLIRNILVCS